MIVNERRSRRPRDFNESLGININGYPIRPSVHRILDSIEMIAVQRGTFLSIGEKRDAPGFTLISATDVISAVIYTPRPAALARCARNSEINLRASAGD